MDSKSSKETKKISRSTSNDDEELLAKFASRADGAAEAFVRRFKPLLWTLARSYFPNSGDAEDAVQEILLELWRTASRFDPDRGSESNFVATVARRRLIDRLRHQQTRPVMEAMPDAAASPDGSPELRTMMSSIASALEQLRSDHRRVVEMSLVQGYTHVEIADAMELPLGTVKTIARRSILRVRQSLAS